MVEGASDVQLHVRLLGAGWVDYAASAIGMGVAETDEGTLNQRVCVVVVKP